MGYDRVVQIVVQIECGCCVRELGYGREKVAKGSSGVSETGGHCVGDIGTQR